METNPLSEIEEHIVRTFSGDATKGLRLKNRRDMWFKCLLRSIKRILKSYYQTFIQSTSPDQILGDENAYREQIQRFSHQYMQGILTKHNYTEQEVDKAVGFMESLIYPKFTIGLGRRTLARMVIKKYKETLSSYS